MRQPGILNAPRHRPQRRLVIDAVHPSHRPLHRPIIPHILAPHLKPARIPRILRQHRRKILLLPRQKIVQPDDRLPKPKKMRHQMRPDKTRHPRNQNFSHFPNSNLTHVHVFGARLFACGKYGCAARLCPPARAGAYAALLFLHTTRHTIHFRALSLCRQNLLYPQSTPKYCTHDQFL